MRKILIGRFVIRFFLVWIVFSTMGFAAAFAETTSSNADANQIKPVQVQKALAEAGFYKGAMDGVLGPKTRAAIRVFQEKHGLTVDGKCGPKTWEKLKAYSEEAAEMDAASGLSPDEGYDTSSRLEPEPKLESGSLKQKLVS